MATSLVKTSSILQGFPKSRSLLAGNAYYNPGATFLIDSVTVGAGGASSVSFSSIPSTYQHLQIRIAERASQGGAYSSAGLRLRFNSDTSTNYSWHVLRGNGSAASAEGFANESVMGLGEQVAGGSTANVFSGLVIDVLDYANTNKYKTMRSLGGYDANGSGWVTSASGNWRSTSAVTGLTLAYVGLPDEGFAQYSKFSLYGYMGS